MKNIEHVEIFVESHRKQFELSFQLQVKYVQCVYRAGRFAVDL